MDLFKKKESMIDYDIEKSDGVPPECWNYNDKPECRQYDYLKEWHYRVENNEEKPGEINKEPTMQESVPECFDEEGVFLEEKCGEIIIVKNEEGMINYIVKNQVDAIIEEFENKSIQNVIDVNESDEQIQVQNKIMEIKEEMDQINNQIVNRTYAPGTGPGETPEVVVEGNKEGVVTDDDGNDGYAPGTTADGDNTVKVPEVKTDVVAG